MSLSIKKMTNCTKSGDITNEIISHPEIRLPSSETGILGYMVNISGRLTM